MRIWCSLSSEGYCTIMNFWMSIIKIIVIIIFIIILQLLLHVLLLLHATATGAASAIAATTVPIRRKLTGTAWQNALCCHSTCVPVPVPYLFITHSIPVLYPFCSVLFPFCQCSISKCSWNSLRRTRFLRTCLQECFQGSSNTQLKLSPYVCGMNTNNKLKFMRWNCQSSYLKNTGRGLQCNFKASYGIFFRNEIFKTIGSLWLPEERK